MLRNKSLKTCPPSAVASGDWQAGATDVEEIKRLYEIQYKKK